MDVQLDWLIFIKKRVILFFSTLLTLSRVIFSGIDFAPTVTFAEIEISLGITKGGISCYTGVGLGAAIFALKNLLRELDRNREAAASIQIGSAGGSCDAENPIPQEQAGDEMDNRAAGDEMDDKAANKRLISPEHSRSNVGISDLFPTDWPNKPPRLRRSRSRHPSPVSSEEGNVSTALTSPIKPLPPGRSMRHAHHRYDLHSTLFFCLLYICGYQ